MNTRDLDFMLAGFLACAAENEALQSKLSDQQQVNRDLAETLINQKKELRQLVKQNDALRAKLEEAERMDAPLRKCREAMTDFLSFYGTGLQVNGWHLNGQDEPLDTFIDDNCLHEAMNAANEVLSSRDGLINSNRSHQ